MRANESMVLPRPDSPASPSDSPSLMCRETSFTGRIHPAGVGNSTVRPRTSTKALMRPSSTGNAELEIRNSDEFPAAARAHA